MYAEYIIIIVEGKSHNEKTIFRGDKMRLDKIILMIILLGYCGVSVFYACKLSMKKDKNAKYMFISILLSLIAIYLASIN